MNSKDTYDIALKIGELAMRNLQFFVAICTVFGGWILVDDTVSKLDATERLVVAIIFTIPTCGLLIGEIEILKRLNAAIDVSRDFFQKDHDDLPKSVDRLFALANVKRAGLAMGGTIVFIDVLIFVRALGSGDMVSRIF